jgi:CubicO group peptidase (beta-lactamase class C family)
MSDSSINRRIDEVFKRFSNPATPGCAVSVLHEGQVIHTAGYGSAHLEYGIPITPSTVFHVASISKQFTCFAILLLAERGKLSLDDDIRDHIPELHNFDSTITIRHLCHHISGIRDQWTLLNIAGWRPDDVITKDHILKLLYRQEALNFAPGNEFLYCNSGYSLLAEICERVSGESFRRFVGAEIFTPLGMTASHIHDDHKEIVPNRAYSYSLGANGGYENCILSFSNHGATSLFTTVEDLATWIQNFETRNHGASILEQMRVKGRLTDGSEIEYAFGLTISPYRGATQIQHSGSDAGFRSHLLMIPEHRFGVAALGNVSDSNPGALGHATTDIVLEDVLEDALEPEPAKPSPEPEKAATATETLSPDCCGIYESPELSTRYEIVAEGDRVIARHARHPDIALRCTGQDELTGDAGYFQTLRFRRNEMRVVTGFDLTSGRVRNLRFISVNC